MLKLTEVTAGYGKLQILNGITFRAQKGDITVVLGSNGCGKSTTLKVITGLLKPTGGTITFQEKSIAGLRPPEIVRSGITYVTQNKDVFPSMTVEENLLLGAYTIRDKKQISKNMEEVLTFLPRLKERFHSPSGLLSGGEQQMLSIGRGLMSGPKMLILDEPSAALSPKISQETYELIRRLHTEKEITILLVDQNVKLALEVADYVYVFSEGKVVTSGTADQLREKELKSFYLGM